MILALLSAVILSAPTPGSALAPVLEASASLDVDGEWLSIPPPGPRSQHTTLHDPLRSRMLVFGGGGARAISDVWAYRMADSAWIRVHAQGLAPTPRSRHSAVYDAAHDRMLVFGGEDVSGAKLSDVWALDLSSVPTWSQLAPAGVGPTARADHVALYDPARDRMLVFGGFDFEARNDLYALDLSGAPTWSTLAPGGTAPAARRGHGAIHDPLRDRAVVFGGTGASLYGDVWELSLAGGTAWAQIAAGGSAPAPRHEHTVVYDALRDRMVMVGGIASNGERNDVRALALAGTPTWSVLFPSGSFTARAGHGAVYEPAGDQLIAFAGAAGGADRVELWSLPFATMIWTLRDPAPEGRSAHAAVYDALRHRMVVLGGLDVPTIWALDLDGEPRWTPLFPAGTAPSTRENYSAVLDPVRDRVLMFGGSSFSVSFPTNQVWALSLAGDGAWTQLVPLGTPPSPRSHHVAIYDPVGDRMIVFGGYDTSSRNDVWELTLDPVPQWTQLAPGGEVLFLTWLNRAAIYDPVRHRMIVCGGGTFSFSPMATTTNEVIALNLSGPLEWERIDPPGPRPAGRVRHVAVYDAGSDRLVLHGGATGNGTALLDAWQLPFTGTYAWTQLAPVGPQPEGGWDRAAIYDPEGHAMIVQGGSNNSPLNTTWSLSWSPMAGIPEVRPDGVALAQSRPNPAATRLAIDFRLAAAGPAEVVVHDVAGRVVRTLARGSFAPGDHRISWDLTDARGARVAAGIYFYRLNAAGRRLTRRAVVMP